MAYNTIMDRSTDAGALVPEDVSKTIIQTIPDGSSVMKLAKRLPNIPRNQHRMPVLSALPSAYFVNEAPASGSSKQTTQAQWANKYLDAAELAVLLPIPESLLDDIAYPLWDQVYPLVAEAFQKAFDAAVLIGTSIPSTWTTNLGAAGLLARATAAGHVVSLAAQTGKDLYDALLSEGGTLGLVEADGFDINGHIAARTMKAKLRGVRSTTGEPIFTTNMQQAGQYLLDGENILFPKNGAFTATDALMFSGDWSSLVYAMRQDITFKVFTEGSITDPDTGLTVLNLMQQDCVALRAVMRVGVALPNPINALDSSETTRCQFSVLTA